MEITDIKYGQNSTIKFWDVIKQSIIEKDYIGIYINYYGEPYKTNMKLISELNRRDDLNIKWLTPGYVKKGHCGVDYSDFMSVGVGNWRFSDELFQDILDQIVLNNESIRNYVEISGIVIIDSKALKKEHLGIDDFIIINFENENNLDAFFLKQEYYNKGIQGVRDSILSRLGINENKIIQFMKKHFEFSTSINLKIGPIIIGKINFK